MKNTIVIFGYGFAFGVIFAFWFVVCLDVFGP